jgi:hypothetical protein
MNFTPKINVGPIVSGILTIAVVGLIGWVRHVAPAPAQIVAMQDASAAQVSFQISHAVPIPPAVEQSPGPGLQTARPDYYQPISSWYKSKHWWKKNAPIVGGAGGGALIGGLVGGGKGAIIGGAAGGGGGYLYKRFRHHNDHHNYHHDYHHDYHHQ